MRQALQRARMHRGVIACALWPVSLLFGAIASIRRSLYRAGVLKSERARVPVIVVGNVIAGGSGKTPIVQAILNHLMARGMSAGVISRGYGRNTMDWREVRAESTADEVGDEPLLLSRTCRVPVFVAAKRSEAARALLQAHPATQVIVADDGLQHHALARDVEICVFDERGTGNGWLLPAGPLREPWPRKVDFVLGAGGYAVTRSLSHEAVRADGARIPLVQLQGITALAGIAKPEAFFDMLRAQRVTIERSIALPDHDDFASLPAIEGTIVCTEKDAVKLWRVRPDAWAVPLHVSIDPAFWTALDAKLSSLHGSQAA